MSMRAPILAVLFLATAACAAPEPEPWSARFPLLNSDDAPMTDSLWALARDSFPEMPIARVNGALGRDLDAPITIHTGHFSGVRGDAYVHALGGYTSISDVCKWHDAIRPREEALFRSCFRHTIGMSTDFQLHAVQSAYRPRETFYYVKLRAIFVARRLPARSTGADDGG